MLVEHAFVTARPAPDIMADLALFLTHLGFELESKTPLDVVEATRGKKKSSNGIRISRLPQRVHLTYDRGRISLAANIEVRGKEYPEHEILLLAVADVLQRRAEGRGSEQELIEIWIQANKRADKRGRTMRGGKRRLPQRSHPLRRGAGRRRSGRGHGRTLTHRPHRRRLQSGMPKPVNSPFVLVIRDGWGLNPHPEHDRFNAVKLAKTPVAHRLMAEYPWTLVKTSGEDVGLPDGTMGNSEVGHQNIGAGRIVDQESVAITKACRAGIEKNAVVAGAITRARDTGKSVHFMGINSDAGVHGLLEHLYALIRACKALGMPSDRVFIHLFTDGRDTGPFTGLEYAKSVDAACKAFGMGRVVSVMGRYYAMDRDFRWERVALAFACLTGRSASAPRGRRPHPHRPLRRRGGAAVLRQPHQRFAAGG